MSPNPVATTPSVSFLMNGEPNGAEQAAIETLTRRRDYLREELQGPDDYAGATYDRRELAALSWALAIVAYLRKGGDDDRSRVVS